jgi:hypothetical protein
MRGYRPGSWFGIVGARAVALLPPTEKARVAAVWALVDDGAGFDEVLDALIADGLRDLAGFVLVGSGDGVARVVIRGGATAVLATDEGEVRVEGAAASTWVEREVSHVTGLRIEVDDEVGEPDGELLRLREGLVRVSTLVEPADVPSPVAAAVADAEEPPADPVDAGELPDTEDEADGVPVVRLVLSHGETVDVDRAVVLGRDPVAGATDADDPRLVTLPSPSREISGSHLEVRPGTGPDVGTVVATDLGSTNGTVVVRPGRPPQELSAGVPTPLLPGAVLDLGDGISIEVVEP